MWVSSSADNTMFGQQSEAAEAKFRCSLPLYCGHLTRALEFAISLSLFFKSYITFTFWVSSSADNAMFGKQNKSAELKFRCHIPLLFGLFNTSFQIWYAITLFLSFYFFITFYISSPSDNAMFGQQSEAANSVLPLWWGLKAFRFAIKRSRVNN